VNPATVIVCYREALGRARNVAHDLEDFEWIDRDTDDAVAQLGEIALEAGRVASLLTALFIEAGGTTAPDGGKPEGS
jgi:hypothetical protein